MEKTKKEEKDKLEYLKSTNGITLIALVITVIVLLILAGVTIATLTGDNGILTRASDAKIETIVATVKENLQLEQIEKAIDEEEVTPETLLAEGKVKRTVQQAEDGNYYMYYALKEDVVEGMQGLGKGNVASLRDVFLIDDDLNVRYIAKNGREYGDELEEKILKDETKIRFASKAFSEYVSKISGATEEEMKFEWMKNQTSLTIDDPNVDSLEDLVFFPNLERLTLKNLTLDNLQGISNCTKLNYYSIGNSNIKDNSEIANLANLKTYIDYTITTEDNIKCLKNLNLTQLNLYRYNDDKLEVISNITSLKSLSLQNTEIKKIDQITKLINLESLGISNSKVESLEGIENLKNLKSISFNSNNISDILPLAYKTDFNTIDLRKNPEIDADRSHYQGERLEKLNKLGEVIDNGGSIYLDVDKLKLFNNYKKLDLSGQSLTNLECIEGMTELEILNLTDNNISLQDEKSRNILASMKNLRELNIIGNPITDLKCINNLNNLTNLTMGRNDNINLKDIEDILSNIRFTLYDWSTIENCDSNKITKLFSEWNTISEIPNLEKFNKLEEINLGDCTIENKESISNISNVSSLKTLRLSNCDIHGYMPDFSKLTNLTNLNLSGNTLWSEELENLKVLRNNTNLTIDLSKNSIIDATALLELNPNTKINLTENINLSQDSKDKLKARFGNNVTF